MHGLVVFTLLMGLIMSSPTARASCGIYSSPTARASCGIYVKYRNVVKPNPFNSTFVCSTNGLCAPNSTDCSQPCPFLVDSHADAYQCDDDTFAFVVNDNYANICPCDADAGPNVFDGGAIVLSMRPDGSIAGPPSGQCAMSCQPSSEPEPQVCTGKEPNSLGPVDEGCGDDEHKCTSSQGTDAFPVSLSSGRVESNPVDVFSLRTPEGISFGLTIKYGSHFIRAPALRRTINTIPDPAPSIHHSDEATHFLGAGWLDSYSDRLMIAVRGGQANLITWTGMHGTVTFRLVGSTWDSTSGRYELIDRGMNPADGLGRWVVRTTDLHAVRRTWTFEELSYTFLNGVETEKIGRPRRHALTSGGSDVVGFYGYTIDWTTDGLIQRAIDSLGRELQFAYTNWPAGCSGTSCTYRSFTTLKYKPGNSAAVVDVANFVYAAEGNWLDRVIRVGIAGYTRFLYWRAPSTCNNCNNALTDVIVPTDSGSSSPALQASLQVNEVALEHHAFEATSSGKRPRAIESGGVGRAFAYEGWSEVLHTVKQLDLHQPTGSCSGGCPTGSFCRSSDQTCYISNDLEWDSGFRVPTHNHGTASASSTGGGSTNSVNMMYSGTTGAPIRSTDTGGTKTTYGFDTKGRIRCIVRDDNDDQAFTTPSQPDTSTCAGPATAQVIQVDYGTGAGGCTGQPTTTKTTASILSGSVTEIECLDATKLLPVAMKTTGSTRNIMGSTISQTQTITRSYDSFGRITDLNGPLTDSVAYDNTETSYHSFNGAWPFNVGNVYQDKRYVGTTTSNTVLTTTFEEYDIFGVPHLITNPNGGTIRYTPSSDRLTWTIQESGVGGVTTVTLNADGTTRSIVDPDRICLTYEYSDTSGYVGAPTKIRRSSSSDACSAIPIDVNSGEVEVRTYVQGERDRLASITRKINGSTEFTYSGFTYDRDRRVTNATTLDSAHPFNFTFTDVLPTGVTAPEAPGNGMWKTTTTVDALARPALLARFLDAANKQTYTYTYASPLSPRPTQMSRGYNGSATAVTTFVYDDFGRLVETTVPESGSPGAPSSTRYKYDVAGRMVKKRVGVGTARVRTSAYSYDSLGRTTSVDHDTEHPVDCATAPAGTAIQDEEYKYDLCAAPDAPVHVSCTNALGRLTISRAVLQCGTNSQVVKRGRWYAYSPHGDVTMVAYATVTGSTIGPPAIMEYRVTPGHRISAYQSPINSELGTAYSFGASDGRISGATTVSGAPIVSNLSYRAFGPLTRLTTPISVPAGASTRALSLNTTYRNDESINELNWSLGHVSGPFVFPIAIVNQTMSYTPAGLPRTRIDAADIASSRYYGYDSLLRMTCEARGSGSTQPSNADCTVPKSRFAGLFTYGDGQTSSSPPDVRMTALLQSDNPSGAPCDSTNRCYLSPSSESSTYQSGSGQVQGITRQGSNLVIGYNALGQRRFEYDDFDATRSRRNYAYLPNGQLGTISGQTPSGNSYTYTVRYDEVGHPLTISAEDTYELFWDDSDRLIAVQIKPGPFGGRPQSIRWHYHYIGNSVVAATRELTINGNTTVNRFWAASDERGFIYRLFDEQGATYWQARWDATGWRTFVGQPQPEMWVPFGLPGQVVLGPTWVLTSHGSPVLQDGTEAYASGSGGTWTRPPIALNQRRAYDPLFGAFLTADSLDLGGRMVPESYMYGRSSYVSVFDPTGMESKPDGAPMIVYDFSIFDTSCHDRVIELTNALNEGLLDLYRCRGSYCSNVSFRRLAILALSSGTIYCTAPGKPVNIKIPRIRYEATYGVDQNGMNVMQRNNKPPFPPVYASNINLEGEFVWDRRVVLSPATKTCRKQQVVHEALHSAFGAWDEGQEASWFYTEYFTRLHQGAFGDRYDDHPAIDDVLRKCVPCLPRPPGK